MTTLMIYPEDDDICSIECSAKEILIRMAEQIGGGCLSLTVSELRNVLLRCELLSEAEIKQLITTAEYKP